MVISKSKLILALLVLMFCRHLVGQDDGFSEQRFKTQYRESHPSYRLAYWFNRRDPQGTFQYKVYELSKSKVTADKLDDWIAATRKNGPDSVAFYIEGVSREFEPNPVEKKLLQEIRYKATFDDTVWIGRIAEDDVPNSVKLILDVNGRFLLAKNDGLPLTAKSMLSGGYWRLPTSPDELSLVVFVKNEPLFIHLSRKGDQLTSLPGPIKGWQFTRQQ